MEKLQEAITQLTGAINAQMELTKEIDRRLKKLENERIAIANPTPSTSLRAPQTEAELKEVWKLPDCVRELQIFDGNPVDYLSWIHNVETILKDHEIVRNKPIYRAILQSIRQKIRGPADSALISYNIFGEDWPAIKKCLSLHYADKRDIRTLEHQLNLLTQGSKTLDEFYANVNHQFSLIVNKIKTEDYSPETVDVLIETYRNRALDVFIRGLNGDLSKILIIRKPQTLPEAYSSCLEIQNLNFRNVTIRKPNLANSVTAPINQFFSYESRQFPPRPPPKSTPRGEFKTLPLDQRNKAYNIQHEQRMQPPPRPSHPKPPVPMEVDPSIRTRRINYMNRPFESYPYKRYNDSDSYPHKTQRINVLETNEESTYEEYMRAHDSEICEDYLENNTTEIDEENAELNFMKGASLAYHT